jgi:type IV pilus assembly protein PilB
LVFSTLHTHDALSSITRLQDMGIEPFLLSSTLRILVAQRLLRRLCDDCKSAGRVDPDSAKRYGIDPRAVVFRPRGCSRCRETGYSGRFAVFEIIRINGRLSEMIQAGETVEAMKRAAVADGMSLLQQSAISKVVAGDTSLEEALSIRVNH